MNDPIDYIEGKIWEHISASDVSRLLKDGWRIDKLMSHFGVTRLKVLHKIRFDWTPST